MRYFSSNETEFVRTALGALFVDLRYIKLRERERHSHTLPLKSLFGKHPTVRNQIRDTFLRQKQRHAFAPQLNPIGTQLLPCRITPLKSSTINYYIGIIVYPLPGLPESSLWTKGKRHRLQSSREPSPPRMPDHHCQPSDIHYGNAT
jgi:hypothetical protein